MQMVSACGDPTGGGLTGDVASEAELQIRA
jgi:hypothetical protein